MRPPKARRGCEGGPESPRRRGSLRRSLRSSVEARSMASQPIAVAPVIPPLDHPSLYINRELSWLEFNDRVLEEALDERNPLLERLKFIALYTTNLDEFFMI